MTCLAAVLTSSACVQYMSTCTYVRTVLTENYSPLVSDVALRLARRGAEEFLSIGLRARQEHDINWARRATRKRDGDRCVKCGGNGAGQRRPLPLDANWKRYDSRMATRDLGVEIPMGHSVYVNEGRDWDLKPWIEVNHIEPRRGRGYGWGCHNHLTNLETLCHDCHVVVTRQERAQHLAQLNHVSNQQTACAEGGVAA